VLPTLEKVPFVGYTQGSGVKFYGTLIFHCLPGVCPKMEIWDYKLRGSESGPVSDQNALGLMKIGSRGKISCKKLDFSLLGWGVQ
jgi:hypothetical protein